MGTYASSSAQAPDGKGIARACQQDTPNRAPEFHVTGGGPGEMARQQGAERAGQTQS